MNSRERYAWISEIGASDLVIKGLRDDLVTKELDKTFMNVNIIFHVKHYLYVSQEPIKCDNPLIYKRLRVFENEFR